MKPIEQAIEILTKEHERLTALSEEYQKELGKLVGLPNGTIRRKPLGRKGQTYTYHEYFCSKTKKTYTKYIRQGENDVFVEQMERRHKYRTLSQPVKKELEAIEKMLKIGDKHLQKSSVRKKVKGISSKNDESKTLPLTNNEPPISPM